MLQSRREFLKKSVALLGGSALLSGAPLAGGRGMPSRGKRCSLIVGRPGMISV